MDEFIKFINQFISEELDIIKCSNTEKDNNVFKNKYDIFMSKYYEYGIKKIYIARAKRVDDNYIKETGSLIAEKAIPKVLFQIKIYENEEYGKLYRCYFDSSASSKRKKQNYCENIFFANTGESLKIISIYVLPIGLKKINTSFKDWDYNQGKEINDLGKLIEVKKIQPPEDPVQLKEYNAE